MSTIEATVEKTRPALQEGRWCDIATLSMMGFGCLQSLVASALAAGIKLEDFYPVETPRDLIAGKARFFCDEDLDAIVGDARARKARSYQPAWSLVLETDRAKLGLAQNAVDEEVLALCERRGVPVDFDGGMIDRKALERLGKLLDRESRFKLGEFDQIQACSVYGRITGVIRTPTLKDEPSQPKPAPVPRADPFASHLDPVERRESLWERYDPDYQVMNQCRILGIRETKPASNSSGRKHVLGFDVYRICGINAGLKSYGMPHEIKYRDLMSQVYREVVG